MNCISEFIGVNADGMSRTLHARIVAHSAHPIAAQPIAAKAAATPRKRRAAAAVTAVASVRGFH